MTPTNNHQSTSVPHPSNVTDSGIKTILTYTLIAIAIFAAAILLFSCLGVAVFLLPLLAGAFK